MDKEKEIALDMVMQNQRRIENKLDTLYGMIDDILDYSIKANIQKQEEEIKQQASDLKFKIEGKEFEEENRYRMKSRYYDEYKKEVQ